MFRSYTERCRAYYSNKPLTQTELEIMLYQAKRKILRGTKGVREDKVVCIFIGLIAILFIATVLVSIFGRGVVVVV